MKNRFKLYAAMAGVLVLGVIALIVVLENRGVPGVDAAAYLQSDAISAVGTEIVYVTSAAPLPGMKAAADNERLTLYVNPDTAEIAVKDKRSGDTWYSNPQDRESDSIASPFEQEVIASQMTIAFRNALSDLTIYSSYGQGAKNGQFVLESIPDGMRVTYTIGDASLGIDALPKFISKGRLEEKVLAHLNETDARYVSMRYLPSKGDPEVLERLDGQVERTLVLNKMVAAFKEAGYTDEDLVQDNIDNGIEGGGAAGKPNFHIPLEYRLDGDSLVVSLDASLIEESDTHRIRTLHLLSFFGAANDEAEGYIFVPDGTGSLIHLNNGKVREEVYVQRVYGEDETDNSRRRGQVSEKARMPVFGLKDGDSAWFAIVEQGDAIASINATSSGRRHSYNQVYSSFAIRGEDELELYQGNEVQEIQMLSGQRYTGQISVRYSFLSGRDADYSGMAKLYRQTLIEQGVLEPLAEGSDIPFYLDMLGAIDKRETFLGVPYQALVSMTSFDQAGEIARLLERNGVSNINMRYLGWFNRGVQHKPPVNVKTDSLLGGKGDLLALAAALEGSGGKLYPDVAFQHIFRDDGNFTPAADAARYITREVARRAPYDRALNRTNYYMGEFFLLSARKLPHYVEKFADGYKSYGLDGLALRDLGNVVNSDYRVSGGAMREAAKHIVTEQLDRLAGDYGNLMIAGGNAYAWSNAAHLIDVPVSSSRFGIADAEVPFYQMVLHGYVDYAGPAVNISDEQDMRRSLLRSIELGLSPHFLWSHESSSLLKYTKYDAMYSTQYTNWHEEAIALYKELNEARAELRAVPMERHIRHADGIVEVQYANGASIIVNYTDEDAVVNGIAVEALNYAAGGGSR